MAFSLRETDWSGRRKLHLIQPYLGLTFFHGDREPECFPYHYQGKSPVVEGNTKSFGLEGTSGGL